jgi:hypothetical protein
LVIFQSSDDGFFAATPRPASVVPSATLVVPRSTHALSHFRKRWINAFLALRVAGPALVLISLWLAGACCSGENIVL